MSDDFLVPEIPFVWPEPRVLEGLRAYRTKLPYDHLAREAEAVFGVVSAIDREGVSWLERLLTARPALACRLVLAVYPGCRTRSGDLRRLRELAHGARGRVDFRVHAAEWRDARPTNLLMFLQEGGAHAWCVTGASENLGFQGAMESQMNLVSRCNAALVESIRRWFDWLWWRSCALTDAALAVPTVVPSASAEGGAETWRRYHAYCHEQHPRRRGAERLGVDPDTGEVTAVNPEDRELPSPTGALGMAHVDPLDDRLVRLYASGVLVTVSAGAAEQARVGGAVRAGRGRARPRPVDAGLALDEILPWFGFAIGPGMYWMPDAARPLFERAVECTHFAARAPLAVDPEPVAAADVDGSENGTEATLERMMNGLDAEPGRPDARGGLPRVAYNPIAFLAATGSMVACPWEQAYLLLRGIALWPRRTHGADLQWLHAAGISETALRVAMDVCGDRLHERRSAGREKGRIRRELDLIEEIGEAAVAARTRCEALLALIDCGDPQRVRNILHPARALQIWTDSRPPRPGDPSQRSLR